MERLADGAPTHPYEVMAAITFLDCVPDRQRAGAVAERLGARVREQRLVVLDPREAADHPVPAGYGPGEHHFAHDFARLPGPPVVLRRGDVGLPDHLAAAQQEDGGWPINWPQWAPGTALECRPMVTIDALLTLRAYGREID